MFAELHANVNDSIAIGITDEINEDRSTDDRQQLHQNQQDIDHMNRDPRIFDTSNTNSREDPLGIRADVQLLDRHIDNMQRLCR